MTWEDPLGLGLWELRVHLCRPFHWVRVTVKSGCPSHLLTQEEESASCSELQGMAQLTCLDSPFPPPDMPRTH